MAFVIADRVKESTTSTGTTAITLAGAPTGYQTFSAAIGNANTTYYTIADQSGANWEVGVGTYTSSGNTLSRDTVLASSNSGSLVTFTSGTKDVFVSAPAERFGPNWQTVQTGNFTASSNCAYPVNTTSAAITVTLPASPKDNDIISFVDYAGTFATNNLTFNPNGNKLDGNASNQMVTTNRAYLNLLYINSTQGWITISNTTPISVPYSASTLVIAGGAGGGSSAGGGGGAGGLLTGTQSFTPSSSYVITVGAGGAGSTVSSSRGGDGNSSSISSGYTSIGGGGGGSNISQLNGANGGSGGGGAGTGAPGVGGAGTSGQGYAGGNNYSGGGAYGSGGGGGAGGVGSVGTSSNGGNGGVGIVNSISGSSTYYAGGGGGSTYTSSGAGNGGNGGGGNASSTTSGSSGTANTGGGGGGSSLSAGTGGNGGSGIVVISYAGSQKGTGGTVTSVGGNTIHTFTSSGTYIA